MNSADIPDMVDGLPNFCGAEPQVEAAMARREPVFLHDTNLRLDRLRATFAIALHMHQPLIPVGGSELRTADTISNLERMFRSSSGEATHNAQVFAECYARMGDIVPDLVRQGHNPRVMLDYSGELLFGLCQMGRRDVLDRLRGITCDPHLRKYVEWLGTMWGHAVAPSTPVPDYKLHMQAWQQNFAAIYGWEALSRVRGFSPPEMHLPNHPDVAYEFIKALKECGYRWVLVQEHTIETPQGGPPRDKHLPHRLVSKNSCGQELSMIGIVKTQGSDTKLVAQMQPFYEALGQQRRQMGGVSIPPLVTQIADGENGGVMMHEFPNCYRQTVARYGAEGAVGVNVTEYLEMIDQAGVREDSLPVIQPIRQRYVLSRIAHWEPGAADKAIEDIKREQSGFSMHGGSWTNNINWVHGYESLLDPMNKLSALFHQTLDHRHVDKSSQPYRNALFHLLASQTSCFRYWGQGEWVEYGRELCRRGTDVLQHDFR
ncbi:MAG TPA: hypothetical protein VMV10_04750 [Pirellulales bacterium]|nr:hypothetical protein [Pirellulales bacterium]